VVFSESYYKEIADSVGVMKARLNNLAFTTKDKNQLSALEIEETRTIANVCIYVEQQTELP